MQFQKNMGSPSEIIYHYCVTLILFGTGIEKKMLVFSAFFFLKSFDENLAKQIQF